MAEIVAGQLASVPLSLVATSPLERAVETAEPILAAHPEAEYRVDDRLIEADSRFAGQPVGRRRLAILAPANWRYLVNPLRPSWGEPWRELAARMTAAIYDAAVAVGPGGQALLVSHQSPIWTARLALEGRPLSHLPTTRRCRLASITSVHLLGTRVLRIDYSEPAAELYGRDANAPISSGA
jgi:broad specificity phosphatase PhoE